MLALVQLVVLCSYELRNLPTLIMQLTSLSSVVNTEPLRIFDVDTGKECKGGIRELVDENDLVLSIG